MRNTSNSYGGVAKTFHWLTALLILSELPLGIVAHEMAFNTPEQLTQKALLFSIHKTLGVAIFFVAVTRIGWAISQPKPGLLNAERRIEATLAETVHWLLYGSLLLVPLSGWIHHAATTGFAPIWWPFGQSLPFVPKDDIIAGWFAGLHHVLIAVLAVSVLLHVAGALKHHFIDKDATLRRMLLNAPEMPPLPAQNHGPAPVIVALIIWAAALGIGAMFGAYGDHRVSQNATALEVVQSQWVVQDGTIEFSVVQFGSSVAGSFANWTAEIGFDETIEEGPAGSVNVTIAIASLTLGSVTAQALGPDFFNSEEFPTARFEADILTSSETNVAEGTLTIKDRAIPVTLYFDLAVADGTAEMSGKLKLDRRDFGIGDNMPDETSLGFAVEVTVALTATNSTE